MKTRQLIVVEPGRIELQEQELDERLEPHEVLIRGEYSIVSAGTEGAAFTGLVMQMPYGNKGTYPRRTGYGHLGRVLAAGEAVTMCRAGDRVLSFAPHGSVVKADGRRFALPVSEQVDGTRMVFARMAGVSIAALRSSTVQPGDTVLVIGMGLVGNLAAQIFQIAGADMLVTDLSEMRLEKARACGLGRTVSAAGNELETTVKEWTAGEGAHVVVEAIGISEVIDRAVPMARKCGKVILLGSPRAPAVIDATPMLLRIHLEGLRMIGALEWNWPMHPTVRARDLEQNYRLVAQWIGDGRLIVDPLLTHLASPADCQLVYEGLTQKKDQYMGVVFDWNGV